MPDGHAAKVRAALVTINARKAEATVQLVAGVLGMRSAVGTIPLSVPPLHQQDGPPPRRWSTREQVGLPLNYLLTDESVPRVARAPVPASTYCPAYMRSALPVTAAGHSGRGAGGEHREVLIRLKFITMRRLRGPGVGLSLGIEGIHLPWQAERLKRHALGLVAIRGGAARWGALGSARRWACRPILARDGCPECSFDPRYRPPAVRALLEAVRLSGEGDGAGAPGGREATSCARPEGDAMTTASTIPLSVPNGAGRRTAPSAWSTWRRRPGCP